MRDRRWHGTTICPSLARGDVPLTNCVQRTIVIEYLQVVCASRHVLVEPSETGNSSPAIGSLSEADSPQQLLHEGGQTIWESWCGRAGMVWLTQCRVGLIRSVGNANRIRCVHGTVQHANLVHNGSLQVRILLHQRDTLVQLILKAVVARLSSRKTIIGIEVPADMRWASARNI